MAVKSSFCVTKEIKISVICLKNLSIRCGKTGLTNIFTGVVSRPEVCVVSGEGGGPVTQEWPRAGARGGQ